MERLQQDNYGKLQMEIEAKEKLWRSKEQSLLSEVDRVGGELDVALRKVVLSLSSD